MNTGFQDFNQLQKTTGTSPCVSTKVLYFCDLHQTYNELIFTKLFYSSKDSGEKHTATESTQKGFKDSRVRVKKVKCEKWNVG